MSDKRFGCDMDTSVFSLELFDKFKRHHPGVDDLTLARFLVARLGNYQKASEFLAAHIEWKKHNWPIYKKSCFDVFKTGICYTHGYDKEGHPLIVFHRHLFDDNCDKDQFINTLLFVSQCAMKNMKDGRTKVTILINRCISNGGFDLELGKRMYKVLDNNFPETLFRTIIYPSGLIFYSLWQLARLFIDPITGEKIKAVRSLDGVEELIDRKYIPVSMGGECTYSFKEEEFPDPVEPEKPLVKEIVEVVDTVVCTSEIVASFDGVTVHERKSFSVEYVHTEESVPSTASVTPLASERLPTF